MGGPAAVADALTHHSGAPTAHGRWEPLHGGQGSISLEYQTCTSPYPFDTLVTGMVLASKTSDKVVRRQPQEQQPGAVPHLQHIHEDSEVNAMR